jgi:uncharacterized Zn-binding protein involved in type VI secretion/nucleoid-associated protein YgaU
MGLPAACMGDMTSHGGVIILGSPNTLIGGKPAARMGDMAACAMFSPNPHGPETIVAMNTTVLINGLPAAAMNDMAVGAGPPSTLLPLNATVLIGMNGAGSGGGGGGGGGAGAGGGSASEGTVSKVSASTGSSAQKQEEQKSEESQKEEKEEQKKQTEFTLSDIIDILKSIESQDGFEAARAFASYLDYRALTEMARAFTTGENTNQKNDPNAMPTRFMLLYGMDDGKLRDVNEHPDNFEGQPKHKINIANLRKALQLFDTQIGEKGPYDDKLFAAYKMFLNQVIARQQKTADKHVSQERETLGAIAQQYGLSTWKHLYEINKSKIGDNPDLLKSGTKLDIPQWNSTSWNKKIEDKGADPTYYTNGTTYRYPWVPFSFTMGKENGDASNETFEKKKQYEVQERATGKTIATGSIASADELETLVPDGLDIRVIIDGIAWNWKNDSGEN